MSSNIKVLQVIPKLGYGGAETGCYDIAHYLPENNCKSFIVTSGGELTKFIDKEKVKLIRLPVHSKNPLLIFLNTIILIGIIILLQMVLGILTILSGVKIFYASLHQINSILLILSTLYFLYIVKYKKPNY